jgi:hypothetical protein
MSKSLRAIIHEGKIEPLEQVDLPESAIVMVKFLADEDAEFWPGASHCSLDAVWENSEDDVYGQLLNEREA